MGKLDLHQADERDQSGQLGELDEGRASRANWVNWRLIEQYTKQGGFLWP